MSLAQHNEVSSDPRAVKVVAKSIYRELVEGGFAEADMMAVAGELLALVASGVASRRDAPEAAGAAQAQA
jgi:hypothetical protein